MTLRHYLRYQKQTHGRHFPRNVVPKARAITMRGNENGFIEIYSCLHAMISTEKLDQQKLLHAVAFVVQRFIGGDKETVLLSSIIYVVDCVIFSDAAQLWSSWQRLAFIYNFFFSML